MLGLFSIQGYINRRLNLYQQAANSYDGLEDGFFLNDALLWGQSLASGTYVAKGMTFDPMPLLDSPVSAMEQNRKDWSTWLRSFTPEETLQIHLFQSSDYSRELEYYCTRQTKSTPAFIQRTRQERAARITRSTESRECVKPQFYAFVTRALEPCSDTQFPELYRAICQQHESRLLHLNRIAKDVPVQLMKDEDNALFINRVLNPQFSEAELIKRPPISPYKSIFENCVNTPVHDGKWDSLAVFQSGGFFHACIVIQEIPKGKVATPVILRPLIDCGIRNIHSTVTLRRRDARELIRKLTDDVKKLSNTVGSDSSKIPADVLAKAEKDKAALEARISEIQDGIEIPFDYHLSVRTWAKTREELETNVSIIRSSLESINGLRTLTIDNKNTCTKFLFHNLAGNTGIHGHWMRAWYIYAESGYLPDFLPLFGAFKGNTRTPSIFFDGPQNNLVGIDLFKGGTPQPLIIVGSPGSGKSVTLQETICQMPDIGFMAIVDSGNSHGTLIKLLGGQSIVIDAEGGQCINYFDTGGSPLLQFHRNFQSNLIIEMGAAARVAKEDAEAILSRYIYKAYSLHIQEIFDRDPARAHRLRHEALWFNLFVDRERAKAADIGDSVGDDELFVEFRDLKERNDPSLMALGAGITPAILADFVQDNDMLDRILNFAVSDLKRDESLRHADVYSLLISRPNIFKEFNEADVLRVGSAMGKYCRVGGANGTLFDGYSNIDLTAKYLHFELGKLPPQSKLKNIVTFLIFAIVRSQAVSLPRNIKKVAVFEELAEILLTETGPATYEGFLAQMRKFMLLTIGVLQDTEQLANAERNNPHGVSAMGLLNKQKCFFILRQREESLMRQFAQRIDLPSSCVRTVLDFQEPASMDEANAYASFLFFSKEGSLPLVGVCQVKANPEVLFVAGTTGDQYVQKKIALDNYDNLFEGIVEEAKKARPFLYPRQFAITNKQ